MTDKIEIVDYKTFSELYEPSNNKTINIITIYEKTSVFGLRKQQISKGAPSTLDKKILEKLTSLDEIVEKEYELKKIPFIICRKLPNNYNEYWKIKDLIDVNNY
jgi:DNA-directed RNA polymerase subunit K/omega